ncbi:MAG: PrsW family glutamic-type intramembrane protease [Candidatus Paceibacterota bacterium]|jgi:RsiW-degrading membrane proteinase PrsW (M82 family)
MADSTLNIFLISLLAGILPPLLWLLLFWLREDKAQPEPKKTIALVFVLGMLSIFPAEVLAQFVADHLPAGTFILIATQAFVEELVKFFAAFMGAMWHNKAFDEPIDAMVYLITAAIGFSALENALFMFSTVKAGGILVGIASNAMRFIGATMLHTLSSATLGAFIGFAFYRSKFIKDKRLVFGLILATMLHTLYNELILMNVNNSGSHYLAVFGMMWVGIIVILFFFEKIKSIFVNKKEINLIN